MPAWRALVGAAAGVVATILVVVVFPLPLYVLLWGLFVDVLSHAVVFLGVYVVGTATIGGVVGGLPSRTGADVTAPPVRTSRGVPEPETAPRRDRRRDHPRRGDSSSISAVSSTAATSSRFSW